MTIQYIAFFIFLSVSLFVFGIYRYYALDAPRAKVINERLNSIKSSGASGEDLELSLIHI